MTESHVPNNGQKPNALFSAGSFEAGPSKAFRMTGLTRNSPETVVHMSRQSTPTKSTQDRRPMWDPSYLLSTLETLSESIQDPGHEYITLHDITESYSILSIRIRAEMKDVLSANEPPPALTVMKTHASDLAECLDRDIRLALTSPFSREPSPPALSFYTDDFVREDELQNAIDLATACHHALRLLSMIFAFPPLSSIFQDNALASLLRQILEVCQAYQLPTHNARKTCALIIWILQVQQLPPAIVIPEVPQIISVLRDAIDKDTGGDTAKLDALKATDRLLRRFPTESFGPLSILLPSILVHLNEGTLEERFQATCALLGFAFAKISTLDRFVELQEKISRDIHSYLASQVPRKKSIQMGNLLPDLLKTALDGKDPFWEGRGASWALSVHMSLIILSDFSLFCHSKSLKVVVTTVERYHHRRIPVSPIWRTLIWAFSRTPVGNGDDQKRDADTRLGAFLLVKQELRGGAGLSLVAALLQSPCSDTSEDSGDSDISKAIAITQELAVQPLSLTNEGLRLLKRFVGSIGIPVSSLGPADVSEELPLFPHELIDGSLLKGGCDLGTFLGSIPHASVALVRPLSETEINDHWAKIMDIWISLAERSLSENITDVTDDLVFIWQALLLVQAQLTQGHRHLTTSSAFAVKISSLVSRFVIPTEECDAQVRELFLVKKLWTVMKNVFEESWLASPAEIILAAILEQNFGFENSGVKALWNQLCADLISIGIPTIMHILFVRSESQKEEKESQVTKQLWLLMAKRQLASDESSWEELVLLLVVPLGAWAIAESDVSVWEDILRKAVSQAKAADGTGSKVVAHFLQNLEAGKVETLKQQPSLIALLLSSVTKSLSYDGQAGLLSLVNGALSDLYTSGSVTVALKILYALGGIISSTPSSAIVQLLSMTQVGLSLWLKDEGKQLSEEDHNDLITRLYCSSLSVLSELEPSIDTLQTLEPFLISAFTRIPDPAVGPLAFENFWRKTYHSQPHIKKQIPDNVRVCLKAFSDWRDNSLAEGISLDSQSQSTSSVIPDSQPLTSTRPDYEAYDIEQLRYPAIPESPSAAINASFVLHYDEKNPTTPVQQTRPPSSAQIRSRGSVSPRRSLTPKASHAPPSLIALQGYTSSASTINGQTVSRCSLDRDAISRSLTGVPRATSPRRSRGRSEAPTSSGIKRLADTSTNLSSKRRKTEPNIAEQRSLHSGEGTTHASENTPSPSPRKRKFASEPVTRAPSISLISGHSLSQPSRRLKKQRRTELPESPVRSPAFPPSDEYSSWEAGVSAEDLKRIKYELQGGSDPDAPETYFERSSDFIGDDADLTEEGNILPTPLRSLYPEETRRRDRSQTAPEPETGSASLHRTPLKRNAVSEAQLDALQHAYAVVADTDGVSQIPVQDLMQARKLANRINQVLDEQMCKKLVRRGGEPSRSGNS